jgi:hypothetical protein
MAKGAEKAKTNQMLNTAQGQQQNYTTNYLSGTAPERALAREHGNDLYNKISSGYSDIATNKGITPELLAAIRGGGGGGGGGGGVNPADIMGGYGDVKNQYSSFAGGGGVNLARNNEAMGVLSGLTKTGGWSPADVTAQQGLIGGLTDMSKTGGLDAESMNRFRGGGVYDEFAKTGGYSPAQAAEFRARATANIPSIYANAKASADQMGRVTGQYNPAAMARMSRQAGYDTQAAATDAEVQLQDQIRQGREWGAGGMTSSENALQSLRTGNMLQGANSAGAMRANMLNSIASTKQGSATGMGQLDIGGQELIQRGKMFGTQGLEGLADKEAAAKRAAAAAGAASHANNIANEKWLAQFGERNQEAGLEGLGGLYTSSPAEVGYYDNQQQRMLHQNVSDTGDIAGVRIQNNPQRDWVSTIGGLAGSFAGAATGLGALGGMGGGAMKGMMPSAGGFANNKMWVPGLSG